ncbi:MAG: hypothetical protein KDD61_06665 [Bdellovibrionales bacterium]|nr:hypothetical protein [Bdellovibrionales bacterium]
MTLQEKLNELERLSDAATEGPWVDKKDITLDSDGFSEFCPIVSVGKGWVIYGKPKSGIACMSNHNFVKASRTAVPQLVKALRECLITLELISKNKTDDCEIYTMGCDCDEECLRAIKKVNKIMGV